MVGMILVVVVVVVMFAGLVFGMKDLLNDNGPVGTAKKVDSTTQALEITKVLNVLE